MESPSTFPRTIGMDIGDKYTHLHVIEADGEQSETTRIPTKRKAVEAYFSRCPKSRVALEVGTHSGWIAELVASLEHEVLVANARKLRAIWDNDKKSDVTDPELLAQLARTNPKLLFPIQPRTERVRTPREMLRARAALVKSRTSLVSCARMLVKSSGERLPKCSTASFHNLAAELRKEQKATLGPLMRVVRELSLQIAAYDKKLEKLCESEFPETQVLRQVSGVGPVTALGFVVAVDAPNRFPQTRKVGSYVGMRPRQDQSGETDKQLSITKAGDSYLRQLLVSSAHYILGPFGPDTDLRRWGLKLAERGGKNGYKRAVVAVARKLAVLLLTLWKSGSKYEPLRQAQRASEEGGPKGGPSGGTGGSSKLAA